MYEQTGGVLAVGWRAVLLVLAAGLLSACERQASPSLALLSGEPLSTADLRGHWVLVNYWAQWCKPCAEEIPELNRLARKHAGQALVLGVNFDRVQGDELRRQAEAFAIDFPVVVNDPGALLGLPRPSALPTTYILDPEGKLHSTLLGPQTEATLEAAMAGPGAAARTP